MEPMPDPNALRRVPVQQRSAERLTRILDACAESLDEGGYEQLTTRAVAARAAVPIGSVYRFFGNKRAMADALAQRNLDGYADRVADRLSAVPPADWRGVIDTVLDEYLGMRRTVPGFAFVDFGGPGAVDEPNPKVADRLSELLAAHLGRAADGRLRRKVLVGVEATDALLQLAFRAQPSGDTELIGETRELLYAYLAPVLD
ncbi:TetR family transcriptional regulator [Streptomyces sp. NBC_01500]|uniref:TetR family transcriptional regulator n=1 Tax=Streptomyces sp. NBC_01500 TaxID=2903886 RepID=UPI00225B7913|nr:TetR family transcriptional regulator [Streptomyces sp. NBC_01500]MCX4552005.1 TetR family transcriptional regulator [Streptomyces sp. NBC_01500]